MKHLLTILSGLLLTGLGLAAGHFLARSSQGPAVEAPSEGEAAAEPAAGTLSEVTLRSLGVEVEPASRSDFIRSRRIQAVVVDRPLNERPVTAPLGGLVTDVKVEVGQVVKAGDAMLVMARDPIPRPKPDLTADILEPLNESVHEISARLRAAAAQVSVTEQELERIQPFLEDRTIPLKTDIELRYALARQKKELDNARSDLELHGLTEEEIAEVEGGAHPPPGRSLWQRVLAENGLWTPQAQAIHDLLVDSECECDLPWCVAAIGELTSTGLATPALVEALRESDVLRVHFADVAGLLLEGTPLPTVRTLGETGALEPRFVLRAPEGAQSGWDVDAIEVRVGQRVEAGTVLLRLHDARRMWLQLQPVGEEIPLVVRALEERESLRATPLVKGSGPVLEDIHVTRLLTHDDTASRGGGAIAEVTNRVLDPDEHGWVRSWALRIGLRYLVEVPIERLPGRFVLPFEAVTSRGADRVVFLSDGSTFRPLPVHVEYEDDEVVVIADDGSLFDGDPVVVRGAFALGLALQQGPAAAADPHAGHSHN